MKVSWVRVVKKKQEAFPWSKKGKNVKTTGFELGAPV